jgi:hypothetical protein
MAHKITYTNKRKAADDIKGWWDDAPNVISARKSSETNRKNKTGMCFTQDKDKKSDWGKIGGKISAPKMLKWCKENNHWERLAEIHRGVPKSKEQKEKISKKLKGRKLSNKTCKKMSESRMGHGWSDIALKNLKKAAQKRRTAPKIIQCNLNGKQIKVWDGLAEIWDYYKDTLKPNKSSIRLVCGNWNANNQKGSRQHKGFIWKYKTK